MKYIQWGYSQSRTSIHIATDAKPEKRSGQFGWFKRTMCGKEYEIDQAETIHSEQYAQAHLCKACKKHVPQSAADLVAQRLYTMPTPKRQQEEW